MNRREKEYWQSRIAASMSEGEREREVAKIYSSQYKAIEAELLKLLEIGEKQGITKRSELYKLSHFQSLLKSLKRQNKEIKESVNKETASAIKKALSGAIFRSEKAFGVSFEAEQKEELLSGVFKTKWSGKSFSERIWRNTDVLSKRVESDVITSIVTGASRETLTKAIMKDYNASFNDADRLIRTETAHAVNQAQADIYEAEGIKEVEWSAGKGERMCEICKRLDGKRFNVKNAPLLAHPNCRCALLPVIPKDWTPKPSNPVDNSAKSGIIKSESALPTELKQKFTANNVEFKAVKPLKKAISSDEIISKVGGGDLTKGSCSSLAFAYAGNKCGYDVIDYRGGTSQSIFSENGTIKKIANIDGVKSKIVTTANDFKGVMELLKTAENNKEYYLATGKHAAIIRKAEKGFEYLELQTENNNGFHQLTTERLKKRFGCVKSHTFMGMKFEMDNTMIDIESLKNNNAFKELLGYINNDKDKQLKGVKGFAK